MERDEARMLYDLQGETSMSPVVGMLFAAVKENNQRLKLITVKIGCKIPNIIG
jgi:hypothetical protein